MNNSGRFGPMQPHAQVPYKCPIPPHMTPLKASLAQYGPVRMGYSLTFEAKSDGFGPTDGGLFSPIPAHAILTGKQGLPLWPLLHFKSPRSTSESESVTPSRDAISNGKVSAPQASSLTGGLVPQATEYAHVPMTALLLRSHLLPLPCTCLEILTRKQERQK